VYSLPPQLYIHASPVARYRDTIHIIINHAILLRWRTGSGTEKVLVQV